MSDVISDWLQCRFDEIQERKRKEAVDDEDPDFDLHGNDECRSPTSYTKRCIDMKCCRSYSEIASTCSLK